MNEQKTVIYNGRAIVTIITASGLSFAAGMVTASLIIQGMVTR